MGGKGYTKQFKEEAMRLVTEQDYEPTVAARELGMPFNTLLSWLKKTGWKRQAAALSPALSEDPKALQVRVRELEAQVKRLETEKEILKKATAYFASQSP